MIKNFLLGLVIGSVSFVSAETSITSSRASYTEICQKTSEDPYYFDNFRSMGAYRSILEIDEAETYAQYLRHRSGKLGKYLEQFRLIEQFGNPILEDYKELGLFSATVLRYIFHADQILKHFKLPAEATVVEIGAGFGGQAYILKCLHPCSSYYVYDLPEVEALIDTMMRALDASNVYCLPIDAELPEERVDLLISNYAYSECDRAMQLDYFDRVISRAERGYLIYNQIATTDYGMDTLSLEEFVDLLKKRGCRPKVYKELFAGAGNSLIMWDKSRP